MKCPSCGNPGAPSDWICSFCDHILDPSVLEAATQTDEEGEAAREERTHLIAWSGADSDESVPEAVMLGDVSVAEEEFGVVHGAGADAAGNTSTFLYYTSGSTTRVVHPDAIPRVATDDQTMPRTPYEDFILSCIDGKRSVREIQKTSGLAPQEVVVTLLTLLDKGAVDIETTTGEKISAPERKRTSRTKPKSRRRSRKKAESATPSPTPKSRRPSLPRHRAKSAVTEQPTEALRAVSRPKIIGPVPDDFDDLPSVSDFEEIVEEFEQIPAARAKIPKPDERQNSSLSDVWGDGSHEIKAFQTRPLTEDSEEVTKAVVIPQTLAPKAKKKKKKERRKKRKKSSRTSTSAPAVVATPRKPPPLPPLDPSEVRVRETVEELAAALDELDEPQQIVSDPTPPPAPPAPVSPILDPAFLTEVPPSESGPIASLLPPEDDETSDPIVAGLRPGATRAPTADEQRAKRKRALAAALKRGPIQERDRRRSGNTSAAKPVSSPEATPLPANAVLTPEPPPPPDPTPEPTKAPPDEPIDNVRMLKAQKLFDQALKDKAEGNLVSARMNMKLALTFDPRNELYKQAFDDLSKNPDAVPGGTPQGRSRARELYDQATEAENHGNVDRAIELLEKALAESKQAAFLNRLGVILATKKGEYDRARRLIEEALEIAPENGLYEKNLSKVLSKAATNDMKKDREGDKKGGLLGFLGRRK